MARIKLGLSHGRVRVDANGVEEIKGIVETIQNGTVRALTIGRSRAVRRLIGDFGDGTS